MTTVLNDLLEGRARLGHMPQKIRAQLHAQMMEHAHNGRLDRAAECAEALVMGAPDAADSWLTLGLLYQEMKRWNPSLKCLKRALELEPHHRGAGLALGEVMIQTGRQLEGVALVEQVFESGHDPKLPPAEQDLITLRAGALLESIVKVMRATRQGQLDDLIASTN